MDSWPADSVGRSEPTDVTPHLCCHAQDGLAMNAIRFLTTVARSVHHQLFRNEDALKQVEARFFSTHVLILM